MVMVSAHHPGSPAWLALSSPDSVSVRDFYRLTLGWRFRRRHVTGAGEYTIAHLDGMDIAGFVDMSGGPAWIAYFATNDAVRTCEDVVYRGGEVMAGPVVVGDQGTYAIGRDPEGRSFGIWQAGAHIGFGRVREPGALSWLEATTAGAFTTRAFYGAVFGHTFTDKSDEVGAPYLVARSGGIPVAGIGASAEGAKGWLPYFAVDDADRTVEQALALGGEAAGPVTDVPGHGRIARLADTSGCELAIVERCPSNI